MYTLVSSSMSIIIPSPEVLLTWPNVKVKSINGQQLNEYVSIINQMIDIFVHWIPNITNQMVLLIVRLQCFRYEFIFPIMNVKLCLCIIIWPLNIKVKGQHKTITEISLVGFESPSAKVSFFSIQEKKVFKRFQTYILLEDHLDQRIRTIWT